MPVRTIENNRNSNRGQMLRALQHRNFQLFFSGQLISLVGTWMQTVAESWLVYRLTGSSLLLGTVAFCAQFPIFIMAPIGGIVADRYDRHRIIVATQASAMVLSGIYATLTLTHRINPPLIMVLAVCLGVVNAFDIPARQAFIVDMVGREDLMNAIALNSSMFNGARVVGPAVAGVLVARIGEGWCFAANSISYIAVITGLLLMNVEHRKAPAATASPTENILEGFRYVRQTRPVAAILMLLGLVSLVGMPYSVLMPIFADKILHGGPRALGILMGATGIGALGGALTLAARSGLKGIGRWIALACAGFGASLILFAWSRTFWVSVACLVPAGFCMMLQMACSNTLVQSMVPDRLRGRVMSVYSMMFMGMAPIGAFAAGVSAEHLGAPITVSIGGALAIVGAIVFARQLPKIRVEARRLVVAQGLAGGEPPQELNAQPIEDADGLQAADD